MGVATTNSAAHVRVEISLPTKVQAIKYRSIPIYKYLFI